jgi:hypothetical protein
LETFAGGWVGRFAEPSCRQVMRVRIRGREHAERWKSSWIEVVKVASLVCTRRFEEGSTATVGNWQSTLAISNFWLGRGAATQRTCPRGVPTMLVLEAANFCLAGILLTGPSLRNREKAANARAQKPMTPQQRLEKPWPTLMLHLDLFRVNPGSGRFLEAMEQTSTQVGTQQRVVLCSVLLIAPVHLEA